MHIDGAPKNIAPNISIAGKVPTVCSVGHCSLPFLVRTRFFDLGRVTNKLYTAGRDLSDDYRL